MENRGGSGKWKAESRKQRNADYQALPIPPSIVFFFLFSSFCFLLSCSQKDPRFQQYYTQGEELYIRRCSNCHQTSGKGLGLVYPPLDHSDYMDRNFDEVVCQMKYGKKGEMIVNGENFNQPMPGIRSLTPLEIAEISSYIYNTWGRSKGIVEVSEVEKALEKCVY